MKNFFWVIVLIVSVSITGISQIGKPNKTNKGKHKPNDVSGLFERHETGKCSKENSDSLYSRQGILEQLVETLNISVFGTRKNDFEFDVEDERPGRFTVYDLTEPPNKGIPIGKCINFINNHVYHFSPMEKRFSFSHIVVLENGNLKVFKSINCKGKGDSLEDVISYLNEKLKDDKNRGAILNRVKNYRKYGIYTTVDTPTLQCK
jgi:hypothetical protein